ncbi:MAG: radical SAM protein [Bacteroidia bacterium]|nr:radical SAM protein [Bacteroidia bacterium]
MERKGRLLLQWHITEHCNQRCTHCYHDAYSDRGLPLQKLTGIIENYLDLLHSFNKLFNPRFIKGHINITGGEPFIRDDFFEFLEILNTYSKFFSFAVLTNGSFINENNALLLKKLNTDFVQVSIEGNNVHHDRIRGKGNHAKVVAAIRILKKNKIRTYISFTAQKNNYKSFPDVAKLGRNLNVSKVWADRFLPFGQGLQHADKILTLEEVKDFFRIMHREKNRFSLKNKTIIEMNRSLMFQETGACPYHCSAGDTLINIMHNGDVFPCRRLPILTGNAADEKLTDIYFNNPTLKELRDRNTISSGCEKCSHHVFCRGGARCLSYALTGNYKTADPGCPIPQLFKS